MTQSDQQDGTDTVSNPPAAGAGDAPAAADKPLSAAAQRALHEAAERRRKAEEEQEQPEEYGGRNGPEPTRYGDWEKKGIAHDF
ncbi:DUF1674 domain-containing protein [Maricaulis sp. CAU 1757]